METFELLDRFELLYPTNTKLADLRRTYIDEDLSSLFRLTNSNDELRKAIIEKNMHSIFRLIEGDVTGDIEDLRKAMRNVYNDWVKNSEKTSHTEYEKYSFESVGKLMKEALQ